MKEQKSIIDVEILKRIRKSKGSKYSQRYIVNQLNNKGIKISLSTYQSIEQSRREPTEEIIKGLCEILQTTEDTLCSQYAIFNKQWEEEKADKLSRSGLSRSFIGLIKQSGYIIEASMITDDGENVSKAKSLEEINFYDIECNNAFVFSIKIDKLLSIQHAVIHYLSYLIKIESED